MGRDYDPVAGQWFEDLEENEVFKVLSVDPDDELVEIQYEDGDIEEIDLDTWRELDLEKATAPDGWVDDEEEDEDDDDFDDDDDWDEDDEDEDDDLDDEDEYDDRE